jgi:putative addiction module component (TIGR02574 family)
MNPASVFDLSPSEKLQLVEDLWDDLATAPEAVPVHDWQKQELARRKANLLEHPASGLPWEVVKSRLRARDAEMLGHCASEVIDEVRAKLAPLLGY